MAFSSDFGIVMQFANPIANKSPQAYSPKAANMATAADFAQAMDQSHGSALAQANYSESSGSSSGLGPSSYSPSQLVNKFVISV